MATGNYYSPYKAAHHPDILENMRAGLPSAPKNIQIDLEAYCPHSCEFCSYRNVDWQSHGMVFEEPSRPTPDTSIPWEIAKELPFQMLEAGIPSIEITGGGESMVYPFIRQFLDLLSASGIDVAIVTNGVAFRQSLREHVERLKWIRFSVDAASSEVYSVVHRVPAPVYNTVLKHISETVDEFGMDSIVGVSFVITPHNYQEIRPAAERFRDMGVDSIRYTFTYEPTGTGRLELWQREDVLNDIVQVKRDFESPAFKVFGVNRIHEYNAPNDDFSSCGYQHFVWAIGFNGKVYPCCIMKYHPQFEMGDLCSQTLKEIVNSEQHKSMIRLDPMTCKSCWLRDKNKFIESLIEAPAHVDFV